MPAAATSVLYRSAAQTDCKPEGELRKKFPLPGDCPEQFAAYAFDQNFCVLSSEYPPAPRNTPSNDASGATFGLSDANAILTSFSQPSPTGAGLVRFSGTFNIVPASWDEFKSATVTFPGWINTPSSGLARVAKSRLVTVRYRYDYFVIDPDGLVADVLDSSGDAVVTVASKSLIPTIVKNVWLNTLSGSPEVDSEVNDLVPAAGATIGDLTYIPTFPTVDLYRDWCSVAAAFIEAGTPAWDATHPGLWDGSSTATGTNGQYIIDDSSLVDYAGNIVARVTPYVLAQ